MSMSFKQEGLANGQPLVFDSLSLCIAKHYTFTLRRSIEPTFVLHATVVMAALHPTS